MDSAQTRQPIVYKESVIPMRTLPSLLAYNLALLGNYDTYMVSQSHESRMAFGRLVDVTVDEKNVTMRGPLGVRVEPAHDPFEQVGRMLAECGVEGWTAYGYIGFDVSRYYFPYTKASPWPLLRFFVPELECRVERAKLHIRTAGDPQLPVTAMSTPSQVAIVNPRPLVTDSDAVKRMYKEKVSMTIDAIRRGVLEKAIVSRAHEIPGTLDVLSTHTHASDSARHTIFPASPKARPHQDSWSYFFKIEDLGAVGSSPEIFLRADGDREILTNPLAGTRRRGDTPAEDEALRLELLKDAKEVKEHVISVRAAQAEVESVCEPGTTRIVDFMETKQFRFVQHLSSRVAGRLEPKRTVWDAIRALFPAITVSGIDKRAALALISSLEEQPRGVYGGSVGWVNHAGAADLAIAIRSVYQYGDVVRLNAGAGIVAESTPEAEYIESCIKMRTMASHVVMRE